MHMPAIRTDWTLAEVHALPDNGMRHELIDGALFVTPAPSVLHQEVQYRLCLLLSPYVEQIGQRLLLAPTAVHFSSRREVQPDILVFRRGDRPPVRAVDGRTLSLAIEILSPNTARADRTAKRALYQSEGVNEYWMIDPDQRVIESVQFGTIAGTVCTQSVVWRPDRRFEPLVIDVPMFFDSVRRE
jgi:Uma2 family endonuclease